CAIDVSDGLVADLGHIVNASHCGAEVHLSRLPISAASHYYFERYNGGVIDWSMLLTRGDDYELCFTCSEKDEEKINALASKQGLKISCIGEITEEMNLKFIGVDGESKDFSDSGFKHF
ncbi:MAG: thiamine-phosphate kinase, partial [Gammaproteobacteria bacterium]